MWDPLVIHLPPLSCPGGMAAGADLLEEHLGEIRNLRQRLEESICINDRLREQLEHRLSSTARGSGRRGLGLLVSGHNQGASEGRALQQSSTFFQVLWGALLPLLLIHSPARPVGQVYCPHSVEYLSSESNCLMAELTKSGPQSCLASHLILDLLM